MEWDIYLKSDNQYILTKGSIRTRLTLFYTLAVFVLLALATLLLYWVTITFLYKADYEFLADEVDTLQYIVQSDQVDLHALKEAVMEAPSQSNGSIYRYFARIYDEKKQIIMETPGSESVLQSDNFFSKTTELLGKKRYFWYSKNGNDYLLIQSTVHLGKENRPGFVQIALDISYQHDIVHDRKKIVAALFIGTLLSLLLGFFIANRGLRSLYLLTQTVQTITATSLDQRINPKSWPAELTGIGIAFNQMLDRMEASFIRLKQFSADLSHELRTPITNLIGATEVSISYDHTIDEYREVMGSNLEELQRISSLIENILFLSYAENPQLDVKKIKLPVFEEIKLVCEFYQAMAEEKNITISLTGDAIVYANPDMFRRMISNILSNALKYTPNGGCIAFTISPGESDEILIQLRDNGIGIAAEYLPKIFDRFYRVDMARSQDTSGAGLGLAIVKSIVDVHSGTICIDSIPMKGTYISIRLPKITKS